MLNKDKINIFYLLLGFFLPVNALEYINILKHCQGRKIKKGLANRI